MTEKECIVLLKYLPTKAVPHFPQSHIAVGVPLTLNQCLNFATEYWPEIPVSNDSSGTHITYGAFVFWLRNRNWGKTL